MKKPLLKMMIVGRRRSGMTLDQLHHCMVAEHGAAVVRLIDQYPALTPQR